MNSQPREEVVHKIDGSSLVSIVIPVYNGSKYLAEAIDSALAQTYPNIEVIVVNDGSTDDGVTEKIALSYGDRIRYFAKENGGVATALNLGIEKMRGEYFSWLSHDDLYYPDKVTSQISYLQENGLHEVVLYGDYDVIDEKGRHITSVHLPNTQPSFFRYFLTANNILHGCTLLIPRYCFHIVGKFNEILKTTQDYDLWFRMAEHFNFVHVSGVIIKYRDHDAQGTRSMPDMVMRECNALMRHFFSQLTPSEFRLGAGTKFLPLARWRVARTFKDRRFHEAYRDAVRNMLGSLVAKGTFFSSGKNERDRNMMKFKEIYYSDGFDSNASRSGKGSSLAQTVRIREEIGRLLRDLDINVLLDAPCGDFNWMRMVDLGATRYIGLDIVDDLVVRNNARYATDMISFKHLDIISDELPHADMILCRDLLVHLTFDQALRAIRNFKTSGARYLLTTTFPETTVNETLTGIWRPLNLSLPPFGLPRPELLINEGCTEAEGRFADKSLALWRLNEGDIA